MKPLYRLLLWASGARIYILQKAPSEWNKFLGIGIIIILTGIMAALSGSYALFTVFRNPFLAAVLGLFWGVFIFFLDWFFIASMKDSGNDLRIILPRLLLGVFLAFIIAKPLELRLFQKEVRQQLLQEQQERQKAFEAQLVNNNTTLETLKKENETLKQEIAEKEARRQTLYQDIIAEAEGRSPTGVVGKGPVYKEKKAEFDKITAELEDLRRRNRNRMEANREKIAAIEEEVAQKLKTHQELNNLEAGFLEQFKAFRAIAKEDSTIQALNIFIILLFVLVELSPILVKILAPAGPYDKLIEAEEAKAGNKAKAIRKKADMDLKQNTLLDEELNEMDYAFEIAHKRDLLQKKQETSKDVNDEYLRHWKKYTLEQWLGKQGNGQSRQSEKADGQAH